MPDEKARMVSPEFIEGLKDFLKSYDYGYHMLDGLVAMHLSGEDIVSQICVLHHDDLAKCIFNLIMCSDERADTVFRSDLIDEDGRQKLSAVRSKFRPILLDSLRVGGAIANGEVNPISSFRIGHSYDPDDEDISVDITGNSGQRGIFRVRQDAVNFLHFVATIMKTYSDFLDNCQKQGLVLNKPTIDGLGRLQKQLQDSTTRLSQAIGKYQTSEKKPGATTD